MQSQDDRSTRIVWAKLRGFPWWPAITSHPSTSQDKVLVRFIGENTHSHLPLESIKDFKAFQSKYSNTKLKHLKVSIEYAKKFVAGELELAQLSRVNDSIQKLVNKKPKKVSPKSSDSEDSTFSSISSSHNGYSSRKGSGLMKLAEQATKLTHKAKSHKKVLEVHKCIEVDLSLPTPAKSFEELILDTESSLNFIATYAEFLSILKNLKSTLPYERHELSASLQAQLSQFRGCDCNDQKSLSMMLTLKDFASSLTSSQQLLNHNKEILLLRLEASRMGSSLRSCIIKDCIERLNLLWRNQFISPLTDATRNTCKELVKLLVTHNFNETEANKIACMSEFKLRGIDPSQGEVYQSRLSELKLSFEKMTTETYKSIRNSIIITEDS
mmetsp:Transcript_21563/g.39440  ORF Transcript_21563/g.39440 Transcript_21563/m.39440 type:complete len:384 (-) Transcript_21563:2114-3265(-)